MDFFYMYGANGVFKKVLVERYEDADAGAPPPPPDTEEDKKGKKKLENIKRYDELKKKHGKGFMTKEANDMDDSLKDVVKKIKEKVSVGVALMDKIEAPRKRALQSAKANKNLKEAREKLRKSKADAKQKARDDIAAAKKKEDDERQAQEKKAADERAKKGEDAQTKASREQREKAEKDARDAKESAAQKARDEQDTKDREAEQADDKLYQTASSVRMELVLKEYQSSDIPLSKLDEAVKDAESVMNDQMTQRMMDSLEAFREFCVKAFNPPDVSEGNIPSVVSQLKSSIDPDETFITDINYKFYYYKSYLVAQDVKYVKANMEKLRGFKENYERQGNTDMSEIRSSF